MRKLIIFTDLDGTLIDHQSYSYSDAKKALKKISDDKIPLILVSSKTRAEIEAIRQDLKKDGFNINHPFIVENGSAIYIPRDYYDANLRMYANDANSINFCHPEFISGSHKILKPSNSAGRQVQNDKQNSNLNHFSIISKNQFQIIKISQVNYQDLIKILKEIEKQIDGKIIGFNNLTPQELSDECGLTIEAAKLAKKREFDEAFRIEPDEPELYNQVKKLIYEKGLNYTKGGRYAHIMGKQDKGLAVGILSKLYKKQFNNIRTIGIGDSRNDLEMLEVCDQGYLVANPKKPVDSTIISKKIHKLKEIGPKGFNKIVLKIISKS